MERHSKKIIGFNIIEVIIIVIISGLTASLATGIITMSNSRTSSGTTYAELLQDEKIKNFLDVYADVVNGYYENVDKDKAIDSAINGMMDYLGDKYTTYLNDSETYNLNNSLAGTYNGIGVSVDMDAVVRSVFDDSPAEKAGFKIGDKIIAINDEDMTNKDVNEITNIIKSKKGKITVTINRDNNNIKLDVNVGDVNKPAILYETKDINDKKVGYIYVSTFSTTVYDQFKKALNKMESNNISGLIIDLRGNGGGYLTAASDIVSMFIEKNKVLYSLEGKDDIQTKKDQTDEKRDYNLVILVDGGTASASEIMAAALKDSYVNTKIVGTKTFGKGKVQQVKNLTDGTMVKYTTAKWLRPNGDCIDNIGIIPDYVVDLIKKENGEIEDTQLQKAMEVIFE